MGYLKFVKKLLDKPSTKERLMKFRREPVTLRIDRPTKPRRARALGYKAKKGIFVVRQRIPRTAKKRPASIMKGGRRPKHARKRMVLDMNSQTIAERRANKKYVNCEVVNSYLVVKDGKNKWYEIILVDRDSPDAMSNKQLEQAASAKGRIYRGVSSSSRKSRGLRKKGKGSEKSRPSKSASTRRKVKKARK